MGRFIRRTTSLAADVLRTVPCRGRPRDRPTQRIENLSASANAVALAELGDTTRPNANEIVANTSAMAAAIDLADRLDGPAVTGRAIEASITALVEIGALQEITGGPRNRRSASAEVLVALDAFAERAGRRAA